MFFGILGVLVVNNYSTDCAGILPPSSLPAFPNSFGVKGIWYTAFGANCMRKVYISARGRITIPADIRRELGIKPGSQMTVTMRGNEVILTLKPGVSSHALEDRRDKPF